MSIQGGKEGRPNKIGVDGRQGLINVVPVRRSIDVVADRWAQKRFHLDEVVPKVGLENLGRESPAVIPNVLETETEFQHLLDTDESIVMIGSRVVSINAAVRSAPIHTRADALRNLTPV
jgi:hypothetical protein